MKQKYSKELIEALKRETKKKGQIDELQYIKNIIDAYFQEMFSEILWQTNLEFGDASPYQHARIEEIKEELFLTTANWIISLMEQDAIQKEAESKGAEIWNNEK